MATTIIYKGAQIATVADNTTKTIKTASKWVEGNIGVQNAAPATKFDDLVQRTLSGAYQCNGATQIAPYACYSMSQLTSVYFPNATSVGMGAFYSCSRLQSVNMPEVTTLNTNGTMFRYCSALTTLNMPKVSNIPNQAFTNCSALTSISFPNLTTISTYAFQSCSKLESVYLYGSTVVTLANANAFASTPLSRSNYLGRWGSIFVPTSLLNTYKAAANWSRYTARFVGV